MARKLTQLTEVAAGDIGENALFYLVDPDRTAGDRSIGMTDNQVTALVGSSPTSTNPIENEYVDNAAMFADQGNQTTAFFQYVTGTDNYYEKLSTNTASISDYRLLSDTEIIVLRGRGDYNVVRLSDIQDDATPITSINGGRIGIEYDNGTDAVTGVFFNELLTDAITDLVALGTGNNLVLYNQDTGKYHVAEITAYSTVNTDYTLATLAAGMDRTEFSTNDRIRVFFDLGGTGGGSSELEYQTEITASQGLSGTEKGLNNLYPVNSSSAIVLTLNDGTYAENDVINLERQDGTVEIVNGTNTIIRGVRNAENRYFINDTYSMVSLTCRGVVSGNTEWTIIGNLTRGYSGAVTTSSYSALAPSETADVDVVGTGFSSNMQDPVITGNGTLNSWVYNSATSITLNITSSGSDGNQLTVTYDNGNIFVDTNAITLTTAQVWNLTNITQSDDDFTATDSGTWTNFGYLDDPIDVDGSIEHEYLSTNNKPTLIGFSTTATISAYTDIDYAVQLTSGTNIFRNESGSATDLGVAINVGDKVRIRVDDSLDEVYIEHDTGGGYSTIYTYTGVTATLTPCMALNGLNKVINNLLVTL